MKTIFFYLFLLSPFFLVTARVDAQADSIPDFQNIFSRLQHYDPLQVVIETDFRALRKDRNPEGTWRPARFRIMAADTVAFEQEVQIAPRGNMRKKTCDFPPVKIRFYQNKPIDDSLADINELKLVISCRNSPEDEQLVLLENLAYTLFNELTVESFRVKSAQVRFITRGRKGSNLEGVAFFIESEQELAARLGGKPLKPTVISPRVLDSVAYARMCLFQYMIGNTDWGSYTRHNMKVVGIDGRRPFAVPYDFDYSGLVAADYAVPSPDIPIPNVRQRYFLGLCHDAAFYQTIFDEFKAHKKQLLSRCEQFPGLSYQSRQDALYYLREFFALLDDDKRCQQEIIGPCGRRIIKKD